MSQGVAYAKPTPAQKCAATKRKLAAKKFKGLTSCDAKAVGKGVAIDQDCVAKAKLSFTNAWAKAEAKGGCFSTGDATAIENKVDAEDSNLQTILQVNGAASKCTSGKFKDSGKKSSCKLACYAKAATSGTPVDTACLDKCTIKFGAACTKDESKGDCHTTGDCGTVETSIDAFTADVAAELPTGCVVTTFDFTINSSGGGPFSDSQWPGGTITQGTAPCTVTVQAPSGDVVLVGAIGDSWSITGKTGFSSCALTGSCNTNGGTCTNCTGVDAPSSCPPLGIPNCTVNRPSCSTGLNGNATDAAHVQCLP
jgi:hypothetical protein